MPITCSKCGADNPATAKFCLNCGSALPRAGVPAARPDVTEALKTRVRELTTDSTFADRYQVIEGLGHGGMGKVSKVHDTTAGFSRVHDFEHTLRHGACKSCIPRQLGQ